MTSHVTESFTPDRLIGGSQIPVVVEPVTVDLGQNLARGAALGRILYALGTPSGAGNTGNGTCAAALLATGDPPAIGNYAAVCEVVADPGPPQVVAQFRVRTPRTPQGVLVLADGNVAVVDGVQLTITEGVAPFIVGDDFTFALAAGSGEVTQLTSTNTDGSQFLYGVLAEDVDATNAATEATAYVEGEFSANAVGFAIGDTHADFDEQGLTLRIRFRDTVPA